MGGYTERVKVRITEATLVALASTPDWMAATVLRAHLPEADPGVIARTLKTMVRTGLILVDANRCGSRYRLP